MNDKLELTDDQIRAIKKYATEDHVIISSGRISGKSTTLIEIFKYWLKYQMRYGDTCVIIGRTNGQALWFFKECLISVKDMAEIQFNGTIKCDFRTCYVKYFKDLSSYLNYLAVYARGTERNVALIIGDECYIPDNLCDRTACAYTEYREVIKLKYRKEIVDQFSKYMNQKEFNEQFGNYYNGD